MNLLVPRVATRSVRGVSQFSASFSTCKSPVRACSLLSRRQFHSYSSKMSQDDVKAGKLERNADGSYTRKPSAFRNFISREPGAEFPPEAGRYHLYVSYACPWAHRTLIVRRLKGLESIIDYTVVHWHMADKGWRFATNEEIGQLPGENVRPDPLHDGFTHLRSVYLGVEPEYEGRITVPLLYDTKTNKIVSNESAEIIRMFYTEFDDLLPAEYKAPKVDLFPEDLQSQIDEHQSWIYDNINNGVYKSGFAVSQQAYEKAVTALFEHLEKVEEQLASQSSEGPYYFGARLTEADVRLYTTIVRFDPVYVQHFKCNLKDIRSGFPYLHNWLRHLYWDFPAFKDTTDFDHIKKHYTKSHAHINPHAITPLGPVPNILPKDKEVKAVAFAIESEEANKRKKI